MTYDSWKTTEPDDSMPRPAGCRCHWEAGDSPCPVHASEDDDYVPDEEPPCEMGEPIVVMREWVAARRSTPADDGYAAPPDRKIEDVIDDAIWVANRDGLHATITLRITSPDGSVVDVTKQSEMARRERT